MAAAHTLDVVQVHGPAVEDACGVLGEQRLVEAVGVNGELHVVAVGDVERAAQLLGDPALSRKTQHALSGFAAAALQSANAAVVENALRQLIAVSPDLQTA